MAQYVDISLDKARRVRFTINAVRELERHFGRSFGNILQGGTSGSMGFEEITQMLTVGLKYGESEKRPLSDNRVGELIQTKWLDNGKDLAEIVEIIMEGMQAAGIISKRQEEEDDASSGSGSEGPRKKAVIPNV